MQISTRWNSALQILQSVDDLKECVINVLKSIEKIELLLDDEELILLHQVVLF